MVNPSLSVHDNLIERFLEHCHRKAYPSKQLIIREGDPSNDLYYIISGSVSVQVEDTKGREIVLAYLNPGDFFGELGLFDEALKRSAFVRAKEKCDIAQISYERMKGLHELFPDLLFSIASQLAIRLRKTSRKVSDLALTDVKGRVARTLLDLCKEPAAMTHPDGMLVRIIKHSEAWLTAYGHNQRLLVTQSQTVARGQKIGEMGLGPGSQPRLYFEIRRNGDPLDPLDLLPGAG
jgi:CRP/FNR family cyclic AMP-dependent transcriptional regulator